MTVVHDFDILSKAKCMFTRILRSFTALRRVVEGLPEK